MNKGGSVIKVRAHEIGGDLNRGGGCTKPMRNVNKNFPKRAKGIMVYLKDDGRKEVLRSISI